MTLPIPPLTDGNDDLDPQAVQYAIDLIARNWAGTQTLGKAVGGFSAYKSANQTGVATATNTKVTFDVEHFDYSGWFASSTYSPTIAGAYALTAGVRVASLADGVVVDLWLYKNGGAFHRLGRLATGAAMDLQIVGSCVVANDGNDTFEIYAAHTHGSNRDIFGSGDGQDTFFMGHYIGGKP